jgi:hypothetical protein
MAANARLLVGHMPPQRRLAAPVHPKLGPALGDWAAKAGPTVPGYQNRTVPENSRRTGAAVYSINDQTMRHAQITLQLARPAGMRCRVVTSGASNLSSSCIDTGVIVK